MLEGGAKGPHYLRDERIDSVKYWLIALVIAGHVLRRNEFSEISECTIAWNWIYIFHMPLFVFFSGYFSRKKIGNDLLPSIWKLLEPLIIYQIILQFLEICFRSSFSWIVFIQPWGPLWFLLSLIWWRLMLQIIPDKFLKKTQLIVVAAFCISIVAGFLPIYRVLSIQNTLCFMPFFFLGYSLRGKNLFLPDKYRPLCLVFLVLTLAIPLFCPQFLDNLTHRPYSNINDMFNRIIVFGLSIPMSIAFINICPNTRWSSRQGRLTLQYYLYHVLIIPPLMVVMGKLDFPMTFFSAVFFTLVIIIGLGLLSYLPFFRFFTNPSSFLKK